MAPLNEKRPEYIEVTGVDIGWREKQTITLGFNSEANVYGAAFGFTTGQQSAAKGLVEHLNNAGIETSTREEPYDEEILEAGNYIAVIEVIPESTEKFLELEGIEVP